MGSFCVNASRCSEEWQHPHGDHVAVIQRERLRAQAQAVDGPRELDTRIGEGLAILARRFQRGVLMLFLHEDAGTLDNGDALVQGKPPVAVAIQRVRCGHCRVDGALGAGLEGGELGAGEGRRYGNGACRRGRVDDHQRKVFHLRTHCQTSVIGSVPAGISPASR